MGRHANVGRKRVRVKQGRTTEYRVKPSEVLKQRQVTKEGWRAADQKRVVMPDLIGLPKPAKFVTIQPVDFGKLLIDESYQRWQIRQMVNDLIFVLRNDGDIPEPVHLSDRGNGKLYIVDGQQRYWAYYQTNTPLKAFVYQGLTMNQERRLFRVLNRRINPSARNTVKASDGPVAEFIRRMDKMSDSPIFKKVNYGQNSSVPYDSSILAKAIVRSLSNGVKFTGKIDKILQRGDVEWQRDVEQAERRASALVRIIAELWPGPPRMRSSNAMALGGVAAEKWSDGKVTLPSRMSMYHLKRIHWENISGGSNLHIEMVESLIRKKWK